MKLFREWSAKWPADLKQMLRDKCQQIDVEWSDRFASELAGELAAVVNAANGHAVAPADLAGVVDELALAVAAAGADNDEQHAIVHGVIANGDAGGDVDDDVDVNVHENGVIDDHQHDHDDVDVAAVQPPLSAAMNLQNGPVVSA